MCKKIDPVTQAEVLATQQFIKQLGPLGLVNILCIPHFACSPKLNVIVKVLLSCVHDDYLCLDCKIDMNVNAIHHITGLSKVGADLTSHFVGKNLDRNLVLKLTKEFKLT